MGRCVGLCRATHQDDGHAVDSMLRVPEGTQADASEVDRDAMRGTTFSAYHRLKRRKVADMKRGVKHQSGLRRSTQSRKTSWLLGTAKNPHTGTADDIKP